MKSKLSLQWAHRPGGEGKTERRYLDILIDGRPMLQILDSTDSDFISRLGWGDSDYQSKSIEHLLLRREPESPSGRIPLIICPECGDLGCGAFTVRITKGEDDYVWSDFAFENDYEETPVQEFPAVGPFQFPKRDYYTTLNQAR